MEFGSALLYFLSIVVQVFACGLGAYYIFISIFAWIPKKELPDISDKEHKFALIVAAHNEESVIKYMVESLYKLDYNPEKYKVFVIADNCTDKTAEIAKDAGATVFERFNENLRGKGHALEWMFEKIYALDEEFDSICIFDADNVVSRNFLREINKQHNKGFKVVQGNIESKNPYDSWISTAYSVSFWMIGKMFQQARYNINLTCQLSGTGFSIDIDLLKKLGWGATCLTEDMEFTAKLALNGYKVGWAHNAYVFDEKPLYLKQSWRQRKRWMQGHADVASRFTRQLLKRAITKHDMSALDCAVYLMQPLKILALGVITIVGWLQAVFPDGQIGFFQIYYLFGGNFLFYVLSIFSFLYIPFTVTYEKREFNFQLFLCYITYWLYSLTWIPIAVQGIIHKNDKEWVHTEHVRTIDINEIEEVKN